MENSLEKKIPAVQGQIMELNHSVSELADIVEKLSNRLKIVLRTPIDNSKPIRSFAIKGGIELAQTIASEVVRIKSETDNLKDLINRLEI